MKNFNENTISSNLQETETSTINTDHVDVKKLLEIEKIKNMIYNDNAMDSNFNKNQSMHANDKKNISHQQKKIDHANFFHDFNEYNIKPTDIVPLYLIKHHSNSNTDDNFSLNSNFIPIITNIVNKDKDTIEITRVHLYDDFYNTKPYSTEKIVIRRNPTENKSEILMSLFEDKLKKEITSLTSGGHYSKIVKFKVFRSPNELLFLQNIYYYRCIMETYFYYKNLNKVLPKKELSFSNMYYHEYMKNLF